MLQMTENPRNNLCLETPTRPLSSGDSRNLTRLWVSAYGEPRDEEQQVSPPVDSSLSIIPRLDPTAENVVVHNQNIAGTIKSALKRVSFREPRVLVQFWSPRVTGKDLFLLTTIDQPFGLGVHDDQGLISYRKYSECNPFLVDKDHHKEDNSPPARVFKRGLPEWTSDIVTNYSPQNFPLQDRATSCNLHGYLALPVFHSTTGLCVGVLELLRSSKYTSFAYEVQQFHRVLKNSDLRTPQAFDCPISNVHNEQRQIELDKIFSILKDVCPLQQLPLAQTWIVSPTDSFVSHEKTLTKSCNGFDTTCLGKVCMSTIALPFHLQDLGMWPFWEACRKRHLDKSQGVVGRALSSRGTSFCGDVTKLSEEEFPLVHNARSSRLTGCFAIFLHNVESTNEYVLEFFLPGHVKDSRCVSSVVQTLKENMAASGFELDDKSSIQVAGPPTDLYVHQEPDIIQTSSNEMGDNFSCCSDSSCSEQSVTSIAGTECANVVSPTNMSMEKACTEFTDDVEKSNLLKEDQKRKRDSDLVLPVTLTVKATFKESIEEFFFCIPFELSNLENEVAKRFNLTGNMIKLNYYDEEYDLIRICIDEDVESAWRASKDKDTISLIVKTKA